MTEEVSELAGVKKSSGFLKPVLLVALVTAAGLILFCLFKEALFPDLDPWGSRLLAAITAAGAAALAAYFYLGHLKSTHKALRESEQRYRSYVDNSPVGLFIANDKGKFLDVNRAACELLGYETNELVDLSINDLDRTLTNTMAMFTKLKQAGRMQAEVRLLHKKGHLVDVLLDAVVLQHDLYMAYCQDISERKRAERALQESEKRYRALFEASPIGILIPDPETREILFANPALCRMFGYAKGEMIGMHIEEMHPEEDRQKAIADFQNHIQEKISFSEQVPGLKMDGSRIFTDISSAEVHRRADVTG